MRTLSLLSSCVSQNDIVCAELLGGVSPGSRPGTWRWICIVFVFTEAVVLPQDHTIKSLEKCDFTPIYNHVIEQREAEKERKKADPKYKKQIKVGSLLQPYCICVFILWLRECDRRKRTKRLRPMATHWWTATLRRSWPTRCARRLCTASSNSQVGNFRVEPPGLFRGRGEHPKTGMVKVRIKHTATPPSHCPGHCQRSLSPSVVRNVSCRRT